MKAFISGSMQEHARVWHHAGEDPKNIPPFNLHQLKSLEKGIVSFQGRWFALGEEHGAPIWITIRDVNTQSVALLIFHFTKTENERPPFIGLREVMDTMSAHHQWLRGENMLRN